MSEEHLLQTEQTAANETAVLQTEIPFYALKLIQKQRALEGKFSYWSLLFCYSLY